MIMFSIIKQGRIRSSTVNTFFQNSSLVTAVLTRRWFMHWTVDWEAVGSNVQFEHGLPSAPPPADSVICWVSSPSGWGKRLTALVLQACSEKLPCSSDRTLPWQNCIQISPVIKIGIWGLLSLVLRNCSWFFAGRNKESHEKDGDSSAPDSQIMYVLCGRWLTGEKDR